jgi:hypothetical protein
MTRDTYALGGLITAHRLWLGHDVPVQGTANGLAKCRDTLQTCIEIVLVHRASDTQGRSVTDGQL